MTYPTGPSWQGGGTAGGHGQVPQVWYGAGAAQPWAGGTGGGGMLASHADRERAVDVLRAGFGEGRLESAEFERRVERAYKARTVGELAVLVADLPQGPLMRPVMGVVGMARPPRLNGKAVGAGVCGLLCLPTFGLLGVPSVVLGHLGRREIERTGERGDAMALTGLVLGWLSTAGWAVVLTLAMVVGITGG